VPTYTIQQGAQLSALADRFGKAGRLPLTGLDVPLLTGHLDRFKSAAEEFQCHHGLNVDGVCDSGRQSKLKQVHGC